MNPNDINGQAIDVLIKSMNNLIDRIERLEVGVDQLIEYIRHINSREISYD